MKKIFLYAIAMILMAQFSIFGEEKQVENKVKDNPPETILGGKDYTLTGYGAPYYRFSKAGEKYGSFVGGRGGLIINENFVIGGGGMGLVYPTKREDVSGNSYTGIRPYIGLGYGGGLIEYYFSPKRLIHFSAGVLVGGGSLTFHDRNNGDNNNSNNRNDMRNDNFFALEPEVNIFINVTRFFRVGLGASYRYVKGINSDEISDRDFRGVTGSVILAFGWF